MVDPFRKLTDYTMPEEGTDGHAALLLAEFMGQKLREPSAEQGVSVVELERFMMSCADEHGSRWRRDAREPAGVRMLLQKVLHRLEALKLVGRDGTVIHPRPALARYRLEVCT
jgi:uncharacterized protein (TIGR02678 family)